MNKRPGYIFIICITFTHCKYKIKIFRFHSIICKRWETCNAYTKMPYTTNVSISSFDDLIFFFFHYVKKKKNKKNLHKKQTILMSNFISFCYTQSKVLYKYMTRENVMNGYWYILTSTSTYLLDKAFTNGYDPNAHCINRMNV